VGFWKKKAQRGLADIGGEKSLEWSRETRYTELGKRGVSVEYLGHEKGFGARGGGVGRCLGGEGRRKGFWENSVWLSGKSGESRFRGNAS